MRGLDDVAFLAGSENRVRILRALSRDPMDLRDLREELDIPRSTVQRNVAALKEEGWVREAIDGYRASRVGEMVLSNFLQVVEVAGLADELSDFVRWLDDPDLDLSLFDPADVVSSSSSRPYAPSKAFAELLRHAAEIRILYPYLIPLHVEVQRRQVEEGELRVETVLGPDAADAFATTYPEALEALLSRDQAVYRCPEDPPFTLAVYGDGIGIIAHDDAGMPRSLLETDSPDAVEWGEEQFRRYRRGATPIEQG